MVFKELLKLIFQLNHVKQVIFINLVDNSFKISSLDKLNCPDWRGINYTLEGTYMDYYYKYIIIQIILTEFALNNLDLTKQLFLDNNFEIFFFR